MLLVVANLLAWRPLPGTTFNVEIRRMSPKKWGHFLGKALKKSIFRPRSILETLLGECGAGQRDPREKKRVFLCAKDQIHYCTTQYKERRIFNYPMVRYYQRRADGYPTFDQFKENEVQ